VAARTVEVDLPDQTTLDQAIVALLKLRRGDVPGDATLDQSAVYSGPAYAAIKRSPDMPWTPGSAVRDRLCAGTWSS
jgi:hypothetical protein